MNIGMRQKIFASLVLTLVIPLVLSILYLQHLSGLFERQTLRSGEGEALLNQVKQTDFVAEYYTQLHKMQFQLATEKALKFKRDITQVEDHFGVQLTAYKEFIEKLVLKANNLSSTSDLKDLHRSLYLKLSELHVYVKSKNWSNLTRLTKNQIEKFQSILDVSKIEHRSNSSGEIEKILKTINGFEGTLKRSSLKLKESDPVWSHFSKLKAEAEMWDQSFPAWVKSVQSREIDSKEQRQHKVILAEIVSESSAHILGKMKYLTFILFIQILLVVFVAFVFMKILNSSLLTMAKQKKQSFSNFLDLLLRPQLDEAHQEFSLSPDHKNKVTEILRDLFIQKNLKQKLALPVLVIDKNLKIIWKNQSALEHFYFMFKGSQCSETLGDSIYLSDFKSYFVGLEKDQMMHIFTEQNQVYQIQLKIIINGIEIPFEMQTFGMNDLDGQGLVLVFYPLTSIQETIEEQTKLLLLPLKKAFKYLVSNDAGDDWISQSRDWSKYDLQSEWKKLKQYIYEHKIRENELSEKIQSLEDQVSDLLKIQVDKDEFIESVLRDSTTVIMHYRELKKVLRVAFLQLESFQKSYEEYISLNSQISKKNEIDRKNYHMYESKMDEGLTHLSDLLKFKDVLRELKKGLTIHLSEFRDLNNRLVQSLSNLDSHEAKEAERRTDLNLELTKQLKNCEQIVGQVEILLMKIQFLSLHQKPTFPALDFHLTDELKKFEDLKNQFHNYSVEMTGKIDGIDADILKIRQNQQSVFLALHQDTREHPPIQS
jgi:hypothetical protein